PRPSIPIRWSPTTVPSPAARPSNGCAGADPPRIEHNDPRGARMRVGHTGRVLAVCVVHAELTVPGRVGRSAIDKRPVTGRVRAQRLGLDGDHVCNTRDHGGVHQAVYGYADEDAANWSAELGRELPVGWFGENLRIAGLPLSDAVIGTRCTVGEAVFEVSGPRVPCATFGHWAGEPQWV